MRQRSVDAGAAVILKQADCNAESLFDALHALLANPERLTAMGESARTLATPHATETLADALLALCPKAR